MLGQVETRGRKNTHSENKKSESKESDQLSDLESFSKTPFILLKEAFSLRTDDKALARAQAMGAWAMVHGLSALIIEGHNEIPEGLSLRQFLAAAALQTQTLSEN